MEDAINFINNLTIYDDEKIVLACSFGPDSMCLLDLLKKSNLNIIVAHVNHKLRKESVEVIKISSNFKQVNMKKRK